MVFCVRCYLVFVPIVSCRPHLPHLRCASQRTGGGYTSALVENTHQEYTSVIARFQNTKKFNGERYKRQIDPFDDKTSEPTGDRADDDQDNQCFQCHGVTPPVAPAIGAIEHQSCARVDGLRCN
jgi:hypothetical protein